MDERQPDGAARAEAYLTALTRASKTPGIEYLVVSALHDHSRLSFKPGTKYAYSNIGYWLLGKIVERASGETFPSYVNEHILRPLGTGYLEKYSLMNLAKGFLIDRDLIGDYSGRWLEIRSHYLNGAAFGGLVWTARGFGKFLQDQLRECLETVDRQFLDATLRRR